MEADNCLLPDQAIYEFIAIYKKEFGLLIDFAEASRRANNLFLLYRAVLKPLNNQKTPP